MTWWRRLLRYLARAELAEAEARLQALHAEYAEAIVRVAIDHALALELAKRQAFAGLAAIDAVILAPPS